MHACPGCGQACACDGDDLWTAHVPAAHPEIGGVHDACGEADEDDPAPIEGMDEWFDFGGEG